jgi:hypothetical protein
MEWALVPRKYCNYKIRNFYSMKNEMRRQLAKTKESSTLLPGLKNRLSDQDPRAFQEKHQRPDDP